LNIRVDLACTVLLSLTFSDSAELKVTLIAPEGSPRVLDEPIVALAVGLVTLSVANDGDGMIDISAVRVATVAVILRNNSFAVTLEAAEVGMDGNTNRLLGDNLFHSLIRNHIFLVTLITVEAVNFVAWIAAKEFPLTHVRSGVVLPSYDTLLGNDFVGISHPAAITSPVNFVTVKKILDRVDGDFVEVVFNCV